MLRLQEQSKGRRRLTRETEAPQWIRDLDPRAEDAFNHWKKQIVNSKTLNRYLQTVQRFCDWASSNQIDKDGLRAELIDKYLDDHNLKRAQRTNVASTLRRLFSSLVEHGILNDNPVSRKSSAGRKASASARVTGAQVTQLLDSIDRSVKIGKRDYAFILLLTETGALVSEIISLRVGDIDFNDGVVSLAGTPANILSRRVPLQTRVVSTLKEYAGLIPECSRDASCSFFRPVKSRGHELGVNGLSEIDGYRMIQRRVVAAGLPEGFTSQSIRDWKIRQLLRDGHDPELVRQFVGHKNLSTTLEYRSKPKVTARTVESLRSLLTR